MKPTAAESSIIPSMPMFTTPARSHHRPAIAPSAIGQPSFTDSTSSCMTLVLLASDSASATHDDQRDAERADPEEERRTVRPEPALEERRDPGDHAARRRWRRRPCRGRKESSSGSGGRLEADRLAGLVEVRRPRSRRGSRPNSPKTTPIVWRRPSCTPPPAGRRDASGHAVPPSSCQRVVRRLGSAPDAEDGPHHDVGGHEQQHEGLEDPDGVDRQPGLLLHQSRRPTASSPTGSRSRMMANGLARASRAMAMESKPMATNTPGLR